MKVLILGLFLVLSQVCGRPDHHEDHNEDHHEEEDNDVDVYITTWIGNGTAIVENRIEVDAPVNTTVYDALVLASQENPKKFGLTTTTDPVVGHVVTSLGGVQQNIMNGTYWVFYVLNGKPNKKTPPALSQASLTGKARRIKLQICPKINHVSGIDRVFVQDEANYLFWYQKI